MLVTRGDQDYFSLLVAPPDTPPDAGRAAMAEAISADNPKQAVRILIDTSAGRPRPIEPETVDNRQPEHR